MMEQARRVFQPDPCLVERVGRILFGAGQPWHPGLSHFFKEGQRSRVIDFPGDERIIKRIEFAYRNLPGGGKAKVAVWAQ